MPKNKNSKNNTNRENSNEDQFDHGPATVALVFPLDDEGPQDPNSKTKKPEIRRMDFQALGEDKSIRGYLVTKSATEDFTVREIRLQPPTFLKKFVFTVSDPEEKKSKLHTVASSMREAEDNFYKSKPGWIIETYLDENGEEQPCVKEEFNLLTGPQLLMERAVKYSCGCDTPRIIDRDAVFKASTVVKNATVQKDGKTFHKKVRVALDDKETEIHVWKDLKGHKLTCPICCQEARAVQGHSWKLSDREIVKSDAWENAIRNEMEKADEKIKFEDAIPRVLGLVRGKATYTVEDLALWDAIKTKDVGAVFAHMPEIVCFRVDDAQKLADLNFGEKDRLSYGGKLGFLPKRFQRQRQEHERRPIITVGEVLTLSIGDLTI